MGVASAARSTIHSSRSVDGDATEEPWEKNLVYWRLLPAIFRYLASFTHISLASPRSTDASHVLRDAAFSDRLRLRRRRRPSTFKRQRHLRVRDLGDACDVRDEDGTMLLIQLRRDGVARPGGDSGMVPSSFVLHYPPSHSQCGSPPPPPASTYAFP
ncbi:hypothetical protein C8F01DRAFT_1265464 [Mycena amicta]|nr:hypothetical protein C8F01DRAFT_1265464 [Mycena amicta]